MNIIIVLLLLIFTSFIGMYIIRKYTLLRNGITALPYGFAVGFGIIGYLMFVYSLLNLPWKPILLLLPFLVFFIATYKKMYFGKVKVPKVSPLKILLLFFITALISFAFIEALIRPPTSWDSWSSWILRANYYFFEGSVSKESYQYLTTSYPAIVPLYITFLYTILGKVDDIAVLAIYPFLYSMLALAFFSFVRSRTSVSFSLLFTFLLLSSQNLLRHAGRFEAGLADIIVGFFVLCSTIILELFFNQPKRSTAFLLMLLLSIISQIKNEGFVIALILFLIFWIRCWKIRRFYLKESMLFLIFIVGWIIYSSTSELPPGILFEKVTVSFTVFESLVEIFLYQMLNIQNWNLGWILFLVSLPSFIINRKHGLFFGVTALVLMVYFSIFFFSNANPVSHAVGIVDRLYLHIYPTALVGTALVCYDILKYQRKFLKKVGINLDA